MLVGLSWLLSKEQLQSHVNNLYASKYCKGFLDLLHLM